MNAPAVPSSVVSLLRFEEFARLPERRMDLGTGALLVAEIAYLGLARGRYLRQLDALAAAVRAHLAAGAIGLGKRPANREMAERIIGSLREVLALREGFRGNDEDYYAPTNSYLSDVLQTRRGLPITLSVIYLEVARRLGIPLVGVALPMHFVVKWPLPREQGGDLFVDVFAGAKVWSYEECRVQIMSRMRSGAGVLGFDPRWTRPVGTRSILTRMLANLKNIYLTKGDTRLALETVDRLLALHPEQHEELRDRGLLRLALGEPLLAAADIAAYAERAPDAPELGRLRRRLLQSREMRARLN